MSHTKTIAGAMLSLNGIFMFTPPPHTDARGHAVNDIREYCAQYFTVPHTNVIFVTEEYEHFLVEDVDDAEIVWKKRRLWYVLVVRDDVLKVCKTQIPVFGAAELS